jgi:hypothetical protein
MSASGMTVTGPMLASKLNVAMRMGSGRASEASAYTSSTADQSQESTFKSAS